MDPLFMKMLGFSLGGHLILLAMQGFTWHRQHVANAPEIKRSLKLNREMKREVKAVHKNQRPEAQLRQRIRARLPSAVSAAQNRVQINAAMANISPNTLSIQEWIESVRQSKLRHGESGGPSGEEAQNIQPPVIDLTDILAAAGGDPVLLSYLNAIREQIQKSANRQAWVSNEQKESGIVFVGFEIGQRGDIHSLRLDEERSTKSDVLQDAAMSIIKGSGPLAPLPPSFAEASEVMLVCVPIEFAVGD